MALSFWVTTPAGPLSRRTPDADPGTAPGMFPGLSLVRTAYVARDAEGGATPALAYPEGGHGMTQTGSGDPALAHYYPAWLDRLADDVTLEGSMMDGVLQGAEG